MLRDEITSFIFEFLILFRFGYIWITEGSLKGLYKIVFFIAAFCAVNTIRNMIKFVREKTRQQVAQEAQLRNNAVNQVYHDAEVLLRNDPQFRAYCRQILDQYTDY